MCVPLRDQNNKVRYFLGAQLDITGLVNDCTELDSLQKLVDQQNKQPRRISTGCGIPEGIPNDAFEQLGETFNSRELEVLLKLRRRFHPGLQGAEQQMDEDSRPNGTSKPPLTKSDTDLSDIFRLNGQGSAPPLGFYQNVSCLGKGTLEHLTDDRSISWSGHIHPFVFYSLPQTSEQQESYKLR